MPEHSAAIYFEEKKGKFVFNFYFFFPKKNIQFWIWEAFLLEQILSHKKVLF